MVHRLAKHTVSSTEKLLLDSINEGGGRVPHGFCVPVAVVSYRIGSGRTELIVELSHTCVAVRRVVFGTVLGGSTRV